MFEYPANDFCVVDQRDDLHRRAALGTFQRIDFIGFVDEPRPRRPRARRNCLAVLGVPEPRNLRRPVEIAQRLEVRSMSPRPCDFPILS